MPTPFQDLYTAVKAIMADIATASPENVTQAPSNYGTDFRIPQGHSMYQVQFQPLEDYHRSNTSYPRAEVSVAIHHYCTSLANEEAFLFQTMSHAADALLVGSVWTAESGVFSLEPESEPEMSEGVREGNVISFEITATVLMDAV